MAVLHGCPRGRICTGGASNQIQSRLQTSLIFFVSIWVLTRSAPTHHMTTAAPLYLPPRWSSTAASTSISGPVLFHASRSVLAIGEEVRYTILSIFGAFAFRCLNLFPLNHCLVYVLVAAIHGRRLRVYKKRNVRTGIE